MRFSPPVVTKHSLQSYPRLNIITKTGAGRCKGTLLSSTCCVVWWCQHTPRNVTLETQCPYTHAVCVFGLAVHVWPGGVRVWPGGCLSLHTKPYHMFHTRCLTIPLGLPISQISCTHIHAHTHTCTHIHAHTYMHTHTCTHTYVHTHIHAHTHTCTHTYVHTHIHTHTHTTTHTGSHIRLHTFLTASKNTSVFYKHTLPHILLPPVIHTHSQAHIQPPLNRCVNYTTIRISPHH